MTGSGRSRLHMKLLLLESWKLSTQPSDGVELLVTIDNNK